MVWFFVILQTLVWRKFWATTVTFERLLLFMNWRNMKLQLFFRLNLQLHILHSKDLVMIMNRFNVNIIPYFLKKKYVSHLKGLFSSCEFSNGRFGKKYEHKWYKGMAFFSNERPEKYLFSNYFVLKSCFRKHYIPVGCEWFLLIMNGSNVQIQILVLFSRHE